MKQLMTICAALVAGALTAGEARYLANAGDDAADGLTPATAWRTIKRLNEGLPSGGTACLKRGDTFYGRLDVKGGLDKEHPTVITAYGEGEKPVVSALKIIKNDPKVWEGASPVYGVWRVAITNAANYTGIDSPDANPGLLIVDGELHGWRKYSYHDINQQWDFAGDGGYLYVYSTNNPALLAKDIRINVNVGTCALKSNMKVSNIKVSGTGACGMCVWGGKPATHDIVISDCDFENIGGSELVGYLNSGVIKARYGNGIEFGNNVTDTLVERCTFRQVYDVAYTMQGWPSVSWKNNHCRDCTMTDCSQAFEIWTNKREDVKEKVGFENCSFTGNRTLRVGGGFGALTRPNRITATPLLFYTDKADIFDIDVSGNTFEECPYGVLYKAGGLKRLPKGYRMHDNIVK